jgi:hypothetical protein
MQYSGWCQQRNTPQGKPASPFLAWLLALLRPIAALSSSDPRWIGVPAVAAHLVGHHRPRSAHCTLPLIQPTLFQLFAGRVSRPGNVHLETKIRSRVRPSERERWIRPPAMCS